jgi:hypothetical protein
VKSRDRRILRALGNIAAKVTAFFLRRRGKPRTADVVEDIADTIEQDYGVPRDMPRGGIDER